jgi:hypothetical protein
LEKGARRGIARGRSVQGRIEISRDLGQRFQIKVVEIALDGDFQVLEHWDYER